jgi:Cu/Ag efflux pump CusA
LLNTISSNSVPKEIVMKGFLIGAIAGGVAMWLYGDQIREYVDDMTSGVRERTAAKLEGAADRLQSVAESVEGGLSDVANQARRAI